MPRLAIINTPEAERRCEVFVIGCGPAGSTISTMLAQKGRDVAVVEKDRHPRFHIGESLLPQNMPILQELGVWEELNEIGIRKDAAEFESHAQGKTVAFEFSQAFDKRWPHAFQVRRSEFDHMLLRNAAEKGARIYEGARVTTVEFGNLERHEDTVVTLKLEDGSVQTWRTKFLVDASGRDTFLSDRFGIKQKNKTHASAAIFGHFRNARRNEGSAEGNITIVWFAHGWFWFIPLKDGTTSVGAVCWPAYMKSRSTDPTTFLMQTIALAPEIAGRLKDAELTAPVTATGNYSYYSSRMAGHGYLMVGDAWAFIDPVFSSGVFLAMNSAKLGAGVVDAVLKDPASAPAQYRQFDRTVRRGVSTFSWLIYRMTSPVIRKLFMAPRNVFGVQSAVVSLLAGDVFRDGPVRPRLYLFRVIYYLNFLADLPTAFRAWRKRQRDIQVPGEGI
ncbi:MAG: tryptophan 7-halogenase [Burkholderiales bacterium]|nr:tryptophan 7-halogenase [Burkholderiales bacterium]